MEVPIKVKKDGRAGRRIKKVYEKTCPNCLSSFIGISKQRFCSESCKGEYKYVEKGATTEKQYAYISGHWDRYFNRLLNKTNRKDLTVKQLLTLLEEQNGLCALSGAPLTCVLVKGTKIKTNASIDRIQAGGDYSIDNVQLVCSALNSWRADTDLQEFIWWCKQVTQCQEKEGTNHA